MSALILSLFPDATALKSFGNDVLLAGLAGDILVLFVPSKWRAFEKCATIFFILVIICGIWMERIGDDALSLPRSLNKDSQKFVETTLCPYGPKPFIQLFSGSIDFVADGLAAITTDCHWDGSKTIKSLDERTAAEASIAGVSGIRFWYAPERASQYRDVSEAFAGALRTQGIAAKAEPMPTGAALPRDVINMIVGPKQ